MEWKVILFDFNSKSLKEYNIFKHSGFKKDFIDMCHIDFDDNDFTERLKGILQYYFWAKCEYEVVVSDWPPYKDKEGPSVKIDVYYQIMLNWDKFLDYCKQLRDKEKSKKRKYFIHIEVEAPAQVFVEEWYDDDIFDSLPDNIKILDVEIGESEA